MEKFIPTNEQERILQHNPDNHARILAGPGTGKSATLVNYFHQLLADNPDRRIKILTFTRAATSELTKKVASQSFVEVEQPNTIHSFAISILLMNPGLGNLPQPLRIADDWEYKHIIRSSLAKRINVPVRTLDDLVIELESNWQSLSPEDNPQIDPLLRKKFIGAWNENRQIFGYTLLAELPYALRNGLQNHPNLKGLGYELLIVDEYQDLNACDLELLKMIADRGCTIIGAGDDDQSIYHFRKAAPEGIRRFVIQDYPGAADYPLSITKRCGAKIIEWATHVISGDPDRPKRPVLTPSDDSPPGECALLAFENENSEARGVAKLINQLVHVEKVPPKEILVLLRGDFNEAFSKPVKEFLLKFQIPFSDPEAIKRMLEEPVNRQLIEIFRLLVHKEDSLAWAGLLRLSEGIGDAFTAYIYELARQQHIQFGPALLAAYTKRFPGGPSGSSSKATTMIQHVLEWLDNHQDYNDIMVDHWGSWMLSCSKGGVCPKPTPDFAQLLIALDDICEPKQGLGRYLSQIAPLGKDKAQSESKGVRIMTMGGAKGLTVQATIVMAVEDGIIPRPDCDIAEERRLLYVAMTRAKKYLFATWARKRRGQTARSGKVQVGRFRNPSHFFEGGTISSVDGNGYIMKRWNI